ncbi:MBL fold metallo-hydrolase [Shewanella woodyi]|uniref:MBL fold metallo-hydrolase n=1 Tax=Shewanella woodyi TaxID=60961 RepID=UPI0009EF403C|nr:MBL fold metallo-hydrolase [Shewanella woodyi]
MSIIFQQISTQQGCQSYLIGCSETCSAMIIDPEISQIEHYLGLASHHGLVIHYLLDTHTHADHFSASKPLSEKLNVPVIMHRNSPAPFVDIRVDDGEIIVLGKLRFEVIHTPGHTSDSISVTIEDRIFTGDTLLIGGTGRTDLPTGNPDQLYTSLFERLLKLDQDLKVFPAHIYSQRSHSSIKEELAHNPRLQKSERQAFINQMKTLNLKMPNHLTESLRTNLNGGKTLTQLLSDAGNQITFISQEQVFNTKNCNHNSLLLIDVREREDFDQGHIEGSIHIPRGQLEININDLEFNPEQRVVVYCESGQLSILATARLKEMGFQHAVAMEHGLARWKELDYPVVTRE